MDDTEARMTPRRTINSTQKKLFKMIGLEEIKQLSRLSKIKFADDEVDAFLSKLQNVIGLISQLQHVNTEGIQPLTSVVDTKIYTREDKVTDGGIEDDLFINVPGKSADLAREIKCFIVPKMVE